MKRNFTNLKLKIRKISQRSLGVTLPADLVGDLNVGDNAMLFINQGFVECDSVDYKCGVCEYVFSEDSNELEIECPACGETKYLIKLEDE